MLFDLRGRGRRRTVQVIYVGLAVLMVGGLVLFGIGGSVAGGLLDGLGITNGSGGSNTNDAFAKQEKVLVKRVTVDPENAAAWAELARVRYQLAGSGEDYDQATGQFTTKGKAQLLRVAAAWNRYLALDPKKPDSNVAGLMVQAFGPAGLNQPADAATAAELVAGARPSANTYYILAVFAYQAGQTRKGDLAAAKALQLAPKDQRPALKEQLDAAKKQGTGAAIGAGATGGATTTGGTTTGG